jgi:hypothetical protein
LQPREHLLVVTKEDRSEVADQGARSLLAVADGAWFKLVAQSVEVVLQIIHQANKFLVLREQRFEFGPGYRQGWVHGFSSAN